jgi:hypothetical protein
MCPIPNGFRDDENLNGVARIKERQNALTQTSKTPVQGVIPATHQVSQFQNTFWIGTDQRA